MEGQNMGGMAMGGGIPSLFAFQQDYWAVVGTAIAIAAVVNTVNWFLYRQRLAEHTSRFQTCY